MHEESIQHRKVCKKDIKDLGFSTINKQFNTLPLVILLMYCSYVFLFLRIFLMTRARILEINKEYFMQARCRFYTFIVMFTLFIAFRAFFYSQVRY